MRMNCYILLTLLLFSFSSANVEAVFDSKDDLYSAISEAGFGYVIEVPFSRKMRIRVLEEDGSYQSLQLRRGVENFDVEYLEKLSFREDPSKPLSYAYRIGDTVVCYLDQYYSLLSGRYINENEFSVCLIFPHKISDVVNSLE